MPTNRKEADKTCEYCCKPLFGRTDKRFCNDTCRNTFNREKNQQQLQQAHDNLPEIFKIIKRNYKLLSAYSIKDVEECIWVEKGKPEDEGIDTRFFTSIAIEGSSIWRFCFDYGWRVHEGGGWEICRRPEQSEIKL